MVARWRYDTITRLTELSGPSLSKPPKPSSISDASGLARLRGSFPVTFAFLFEVWAFTRASYAMEVVRWYDFE